MAVRTRWWRMGVLVGWMVLIAVWSDQSSLPIDHPEIKLLLFNLQHRLAHLVAYGILGLLAGWAFDGWRYRTAMAIALASLFGATDEWHQSFVPGRRAGIDDWAFDTFSAGLALYLWPRFRRWRPRFAAFGGPLAIASIFAIGLLLLIRPHLSRPSDLSATTLRSVSSQVLSSAREVARQIRSTVNSG